MADESDGTDTPASRSDARDWSAWLDGRPRRLKRGRDYTGDPKVVAREAREVAEAAGKVAVISNDSQGKYEYLWVQFVGGEVELGDRCPVCEGVSFAKVQKYFLRCSACGAILKAADDREVTAGEFTRPTPGADAGDGPVRDPAVEMGPSGEEFAEILGARLLTLDGHELVEPSVADVFTLEVALRFKRAVEVATLRLELLLREGGPAIRLNAPEVLQASGPGIVEVRVRVPRGLLAPRRYRVGVTAFLRPDADGPAGRLVVWGAPLSFRVLKAEPRRLEDMAALGSALDWEVEDRPDDGPPDDAPPRSRRRPMRRRISEAPAVGDRGR